jgi:hypothetical protein
MDPIMTFCLRKIVGLVEEITGELEINAYIYPVVALAN